MNRPGPLGEGETGQAMTDFELGEESGRNRKDFADCPYLFSKVNVPQEEFDRTYRPRMSDWFEGWKASGRQNPRIPLTPC